MISVRNLQYQLPNKRQILSGIDFELGQGEFLAVLGENGAGKTTLLDILMGFRRRTGGEVKVTERDPVDDPWETRSNITYLSEKVDIPGDWDAEEFLDFHRYFYRGYDVSEEQKLIELFGISKKERVGNLSAGEIRRLQIVGALAAQPDLVIADEITAVLDILARRKFLKVLQERQRGRGMAIVLATNVPEGLEAYAHRVLLIHRGQQITFSKTSDFLNGDKDLGDAAAKRLEQL